MMQLLLPLSCLFGALDAANILAFSHTPAISHQFVFRSIVKELSLRGHSVTFVTTDPMNDPTLTNLTEVDISVSYEIYKKTDASVFNRESTDLIKMGFIGLQFLYDVTLMQLEVQGVKDILKKPPKSFDLIITETGNAFYKGLQHKFKAPLISVSSYGLPRYLHELLGNSGHPMLYLDIFSRYPVPISNIWEKLDSLYVYLVNYMLCQFYMFPTFDKLARSHFGEDMPYIKDLIKETSLVVANVNPIFSNNRPSVPNVIEVWNIHLNRSEPLKEDLQHILDNAKDGAVYFSLGTNVRFDHVQGDFKEAVLRALGQLPYTVLCKWESEDYPGKPNNVILRRWFPQQSIMGHPNLRVFVTQGGLQSSEEAISNGVPMVVIPFLGDQPMNAKILSKKGIAETIIPSSLTGDILRDTILKVAGDEKYRIRARELRSIFLDQPQTGLERIIWWSEYIIRHKGAKHLKSPSADISLYEYFMLDILAIILSIIFVVYSIFKLLVPILVVLYRRNVRVKMAGKKLK
ncbi:hypothetical protein WA026_018366 [Henosepilachna vigintioctopunctata]|uniref:UDP-glucuronosyltransferase n=1 Tax=Henosepilachna vigintioctopunctata TaxID=420089 RepID=A0AAW1VFD6_9CUCU